MSFTLGSMTGARCICVPKSKGEGVHHKLKKSGKLALSKTRCASAAAKASGDTIPTGLMQNAGDLYKEMMGDATGDYLNKSLRKLTLGQLEELNAKMEEMALNERTCKKLCGNIFPLYAELVNVKDRVGGVLEAPKPFTVMQRQGSTSPFLMWSVLSSPPKRRVR
jgi:hypothetical protein